LVCDDAGQMFVIKLIHISYLLTVEAAGDKWEDAPELKGEFHLILVS
jgi:hypothetical protein